MKELVNNKITKEEKGSITVWLTLLTIIVMTFIMVAIEGVKIINAQNICSNSSNLATMSLMADYDLDIYENYGIYVMSKDVEIETFRDHVKASLESNLLLDEINVKKINYLNNEYMEKQILKETSIYDYLLKNFTSYKKPYIKGYMNRKYSYELEYIIGGEEKDNDNIRIIKNKLSHKDTEDVINELNMTDEEYESYIIELIEQIEKNTLYNRIKEIIISNINKTFEKNLDDSKLIVGIDIFCKFKINSYWNNNLIKSLYNNINNKYVVNINSKYGYDNL